MTDSHSSKTQHHSQQVLLHEETNTKNNVNVFKPAHDHRSEDLVLL
jgi:hypothetical protein